MKVMKLNLECQTMGHAALHSQPKPRNGGGGGGASLSPSLSLLADGRTTDPKPKPKNHTWPDRLTTTDG